MNHALIEEQIKLYLDWCQQRNLKTVKVATQNNLAEITNSYLKEKEKKEIRQENFKKIIALGPIKSKQETFFSLEENILWEKMIQAVGYHPKKEVELLSFCPIEKESIESNAHKKKLKQKLFTQLFQLNSSYLIILGQAAYDFLWSGQKPWQEVVYKKYSLNINKKYIQIFLLPHPSELLVNASLKKPTWMSLKKIAAIC